MLYFVTSNISKFEEVKKIFTIYQIPLKRINIDLPEIKSLHPEEVIIDKAKKAYQILKKPLIVDDTGIFFSNYYKFPGTISRFIFITLGFKGIFKLIKKDQPAYFATYLAYIGSPKEMQICVGKCFGHLITKIQGKRRKKMPYDSIFMPRGENRTFSQLGISGKQKYDHRSKAARKLAQYLSKKR